MTVQSQNWCFHLVLASFLETAWLFSSLCWEMSEKLWHSWRCVVSSLIAIDTWWGMNSTPLKIILCVNGWEESKSHSSLVLPEGTLFPFMWLNPSVSKIFLRFPSHISHNHPAFAEQTGTSDRCKYSPSSLWVPPAWFLWEVFAVWPALGTPFFFHYCHVFEVHVLLRAAGLKLLFVWYSALVFLTSQRGQKYSPPMDHGGSWKPD